MSSDAPAASSPTESSQQTTATSTNPPMSEDDMAAAVAAQKRARALEAHSSLKECRGCSNKAKRDCINQCCKTCCSMTGVPCASHAAPEKPSRATASAAAATPTNEHHATPAARARAAEYSMPVYDNYPNDPSATIGSCVIGAVEGHCSSGLLVQVLIGGWVLHGVLFDEPASIEIAQLPNAATIRSEALLIAPEPSAAMVFESPMTHFHTITKTNPPYVPNEPLQTALYNQYQPSTYNPSTTYQQYQPDDQVEYIDENGLKRSRPSTGYDDSEQKPKRVRKSRAQAAGPKGPRSAYIYFQAAVRAKLQTAPESEHAAITTQWDWSRITEDEKKPYYLMADADKQRFDRELAEYLRSNPDHHQDSDARPLESLTQ